MNGSSSYSETYSYVALAVLVAYHKCNVCMQKVPYIDLGMLSAQLVVKVQPVISVYCKVGSVAVGR